MSPNANKHGVKPGDSDEAYSMCGIGLNFPPTDMSIYIYISISISISIYLEYSIRPVLNESAPVVPHKAVAEVSKIERLQERLVVVNH